MSDQSSVSAAGAIVVIAEFAVAPEHKAEFLALCEQDGRNSVASEPGCRQFDTLLHEETPDAVILFEVYDDKAAVEAHLRTPHYALFAEGVERLGVAKTQVRFLSRAHRGGA
jgi:quinol monooxygenase YgiN